jgi:uncharacterized damage-inducible protein DinB
MKELLLNYVRYNQWANRRLGEIFAQLSDEQLDREMKSSFPTIRKTAFHIYGAEKVWMSRLAGVSPSSFPALENSGFAVSRFSEAADEFVALLEGKDESFFTAMNSFKNLKGEVSDQPVHEMIMHCMNHSTFHRGQLVTMIREAGWNGALPSTDLVNYNRGKQR